MSVRILTGDVRTRLRDLPDASVHCVVTSPPYWGLRDYGAEQQIGCEPSFALYVRELVSVFSEIHRVLRPDGTVWLNLGDSYAGSGKGPSSPGSMQRSNQGSLIPGKRTPDFLKPKDLAGIPWRVAFALQDFGWYLRQDIIWCLSGGAWVYARTHKGDMPVMVKDLVRLNPSTVKLWNGQKWTQVLGWGPSADTSQRFELVLRSGERIGCTGPHQWPTQRGNVAARDLVVGDVIKTCTLPEPQTNRPPYLIDDLLWLIGLYLAEGSRCDDTIQISLHADESKWLPRIKSAAESLGATMGATTNENVLNVRLYGRVLRSAIEEYVGGSTARDKHLRNAAWRLPDTALRVIVGGYLDGDGHYDEQNARYRLGFARNYLLERDLRTLAARLDAVLTLHPSTARYQNGSRPSFKGEWRWERSGHFNEKDRSEIIEIRASRARKFWDIAVEDEPHLFALASGVLTHNCKPNPMPESVTDRCTKSHEYIFLLSKSEKYYYDQESIKEPASYSTEERKKRSREGQKRMMGEKVNGIRPDRQRGHSRNHAGFNEKWDKMTKDEQCSGMKNKRSVWTVATRPFPEAHFATYPEELIRPCVLAGCPPGGTVLDPFGGAGTTAVVAEGSGRNSVLVELNPDYVGIAERRIRKRFGMMLDLTVDVSGENRGEASVPQEAESPLLATINQ